MQSAAIFIQARLNSKRLPGKVLKKACGKPLLAFLLDRLLLCKLPIFLLVPKKDKDAFSHFLKKVYPKSSIHNMPQTMQASPSTRNASEKKNKKKIGVELFCGPENDVLKRFFQASLLHQFDHYIRVTADNPLTCELCLKLVLKHHLEKNKKEKIDLSHPIGLPYGAGVEIISRAALKKLSDEPSLTKRQREHVTLFIHENPKLFAVQTVEVVKKCRAPLLRVTVDTQEDFDLFIKRMKRNDGAKKIVPLKEIIETEKNQGNSVFGRALSAKRKSSVT